MGIFIAGGGSHSHVPANIVRGGVGVRGPREVDVSTINSDPSGQVVDDHRVIKLLGFLLLRFICFSQVLDFVASADD